MKIYFCCHMEEESLFTLFTKKDLLDKYNIQTAEK